MDENKLVLKKNQSNINIILEGFFLLFSIILWIIYVIMTWWKSLETNGFVPPEESLK